MTKQTMNEFLIMEARALSQDHIVYFSKPYPCCVDEALSYFRKWDKPDDKSMVITREEKQTTISIKPLKGSGARKPYVIKLWASY